MEHFIVVEAQEALEPVRHLVRAANLELPNDHILSSPGRSSAIGDAGTLLHAGDTKVALFLSPGQPADFARDLLGSVTPNPNNFFIASTGLQPESPQYRATQQALKELFTDSAIASLV